jgi:aarF domain-containing kinase
MKQAAPSHPYKYTRRVIKDAFGYEIDELFSEFESEPIASGTIGQVYRAVISSSGSALLAAEGQAPPPADMVVAVKVRHPGVQEAIRHDFTVIRLISSALNLIPSLEWLHLDEMTWQFETLLGAQVNPSRQTATCLGQKRIYMLAPT